MILTRVEARMGEGKAVYDPDVLAIARAAFYEACDLLPPERNTQSTRASIAECVLQAVGEGERDPARLRRRALLSVDTAE